ncbi:uncharacterized protein LOC143169782 isoform X7 [Aptenodytes patagonicus]|uniref:uncharacterized protein LOC143169782 isoform X7 n=1 Tax=Aptenodytes patagonicus TaxID=9234 RepID=UPI003FA0EC79
MQGLRGRKQSRAFQPGFPWRLWLQRQLPAEVSAVPSNQSHPGMEGDPGAQDGWWRPRLGGVGRGCLTFRSALGRWPACRIDPRARIVGKL